MSTKISLLGLIKYDIYQILVLAFFCKY